MDDGESIDATARVIVSPAVGSFSPTVGPVIVERGDVIGHIAVAGQSAVPVCSPFRGELVEMVAWPGERVAHRQRIAWMRVA